MNTSQPIANQSCPNDCVRLDVSISDFRIKCRNRAERNSGAVLIIVMWVAFGLISLALYFAHSTSFEIRSADNRIAGSEAEQAIEGAARYISLVLSNNPGYLPDPQSFQNEAVPVGDATYWIIGRDYESSSATATTPFFGLIDEASKLNLNTASLTNLEMLPNMNSTLAASIMIWKGKTNNISGASGATDMNYAALNPPYSCKGSNFETTAELRLVYGMDMATLYGEDANLNGFLDVNENDGDTLPPSDNRDGRLDPGLLEYVTVYTSDPNLSTNGTARASVNDIRALTNVLTAANIDQSKIKTLTTARTYTSVLDFYVKNKNTLTDADFQSIADNIATDTNSPLKGLINANTASADVLGCLEGFTYDMGVQMVNYRKTNPNNLTSIAWVANALGLNESSTIPAGASRLTVHSYQFTADIAAVGHHDRGYRRVRFVFDTSTGVPTIIYRQDLSHLGWALGKDIREQLLTAKETR